MFNVYRKSTGELVLVFRAATFREFFGTIHALLGRRSGDYRISQK